MKTCTKCGQTKALEKFNRNRRAKDGRQSRCKACQREYNARYRAENREQERERVARWHAENRDRKREYAARWREKNRERQREYFARYRAENRERYREYSARWRAENKDNPEYQERARARDARRRARKRGLPDDGSDVSDWLSHMEETDVWYCHLCGGAFAAGDEIHWDHRDPISTGTAGTVLSNMAAAHAACNISRGNTPLHEWSTRVGLPDGVV